MRKIIAMFIVLDIIYQLFGITDNINWWLYYDLIHYGVLFAIAFYYVFEKIDKLMIVFTSYFGFCLGNIVYQFTLSDTELLDNIKHNYISFSYFILSALLLFIIYKVCQKSKKIG